MITKVWGIYCFEKMIYPPLSHSKRYLLLLKHHWKNNYGRRYLKWCRSSFVSATNCHFPSASSCVSLGSGQLYSFLRRQNILRRQRECVNSTQLIVFVECEWQTGWVIFANENDVQDNGIGTILQIKDSVKTDFKMIPWRK